MSGAESALLRAALSLADRGWHVFPCAPGAKQPALHGNWQDHATTDPRRIRDWWSRAAHNIAVACGPSGLVVLDLDVPAMRGVEAPATSGTETLAMLCAWHCQPYPLPTYAVSTPSGGSHLYYAAGGGQTRNSAGRLGPLIDVRADGGYVIGAGSRLGTGIYTVLDQRQPAPLPAWISLLNGHAPAPSAWRPSPAPAQGTAYAMAALRDETRQVAEAQPGTRNDRLNRAAFSLGQLIAAGLLPSLAVVSALADAAERAGLPGEEARRTIRSGMTAGIGKPRAATRR